MKRLAFTPAEIAHSIKEQQTQPADWQHISIAKVRQVNRMLTTFGWAGPPVIKPNKRRTKPKRPTAPEVLEAMRNEIAKADTELAHMAEQMRASADKIVRTRRAIRAAQARLQALEAML
jgi:septal ring factor EnvC (AmiA/AmiB activator)